MTTYVKAFVLGLSMTLVAGPALAGNKQAQRQAEAHRLQEEMSKLAQRNAWSGVDRSYRKLMKLKKVKIKPEAHTLGAQAARNEGDVSAYMKRLQRAGAAGKDELAAAKRAYGRVVIKRQRKRELKPATAPFDPTHRKVIEKAAARIKKKGRYKGWLPVGRYTIGPNRFEVKAGKVVKVKKRK